MRNKIMIFVSIYLLGWSAVCSAWEWPDKLYIAPGQTWRSPPVIIPPTRFDGHDAVNAYGDWDLLDSFIVPRLHNLGPGLTWTLVGDSGMVYPDGKPPVPCTISSSSYYGTPASVGDGDTASQSIVCGTGIKNQYNLLGASTGTISMVAHIEVINTGSTSGVVTNLEWPAVYGVSRTGRRLYGYSPDYWSSTGWGLLVPGKKGMVISTGLTVNVSPINISFKSQSGEVMARGNLPTTAFVKAQTDGSDASVGLALVFSDNKNTIATTSPDVNIHGSFNPGATCSTPGEWLSKGNDLYIPLGVINNNVTINKNIYWLACISPAAVAQKYSGSVEYHVSVY